MALPLSREELRKKMMGCWLGKAVGGTLGQSFEGQEGPLSATFYDPIPTAMERNDDLDLQVLWAIMLDKLENVRVDRRVLEQGWLRHVRFPWNDYDVVIRNLRDGLPAPLSGSHDKWFTCSEVAAIRTELWACLAVGDPKLAASSTYEDACVDHAGDGINAALFLASIQAAAFIESDTDRLLDLGLAAVPGDSELARAVTATRSWVAEAKSSQEVRELVLQDFGSVDFTDVRQNTAFLVLAWLIGKDFSERILVCNNCGRDTDSSTASLGSILGIIDPDQIDDRWLAPIGRDLVLSPEITGIDTPATLDDFADLVLCLRDRLAGQPARPGDALHVADPPIVEAEFAFINFLDRQHIDSRFLPHPGDNVPRRKGDEKAVQLSGTWHRMPREEFLDDVAVFRFRIKLQADQHVQVMSNTTEQCWVAINGKFAFARDIGPYGEAAAMFPAVHGPPTNQYSDVQLAAGSHTPAALVRRPQLPRQAEWVIGVGDVATGMWFNGAIGRIAEGQG